MGYGCNNWALYMVGAVEIAAGLVVALSPRFGGLLVAGWLAGIIVSLLLVGGYADIALRDFGLLVGALALVPPGKRSRPCEPSEDAICENPDGRGVDRRYSTGFNARRSARAAPA